MQIMSVRLAISMLILFFGALGSRNQEPTASGDQSTKTIEVSSKKYEFTPGEIHVKKGTNVKLIVHTVDETHGIKLSLYPEGSKQKSSPGLIFAAAAQNGEVQKGKDQVLEFVAQQPGTYEFKCAKLCGFGHGRMKGKLVVEE